MKGDPSPTWLRLRLFAVLTAGKGNGTGVYAEIFVSLILHFFVFNLFIFFVNSLICSVLFFIPIPFTRRDFYFIKLIFYNFFLSIYLFFSILFFYPRHLPTPATHNLYPLPTTFSYAHKYLTYLSPTAKA